MRETAAALAVVLALAAPGSAAAAGLVAGAGAGDQLGGVQVLLGGQSDGAGSSCEEEEDVELHFALFGISGF